MATEYAVDVPESTKAANGQAMKKPEHWTFTTPPPVLKQKFPQSGSVPREPILFAEFDQEIDPQKMLASIELYSNRSNTPPVAIEIAPSDEVEANDGVRRLAQQAEKGRFLAFRPKEKLPTATSFTVKVKKGAPSAEGPRTTDRDQSWSFSMLGPL
jgi:hypothetical protein